MDSSAKTKQTDPHDVSPGLSTQEIELVARADEQRARANEQDFKQEHDAARKRAVNRLRRSSRDRPALRGFIALLLTAFICIAAFVSQSYGETARLMIARWAPQSAPASSGPSEAPKLAAQESPPAVRVAEADSAISKMPPPAQTAPQDAPAAPIPPELTQLLQTMARDLANVQQEVEQIRTSQQELARENAGIAEQLKASQEQMARAIANATEQKPRPKPSAATSAAASATRPPPIATPPRKPVSTPPTQARAQVRAPVQLQRGQQ